LQQSLPPVAETAPDQTSADVLPDPADATAPHDRTPAAVPNGQAPAAATHDQAPVAVTHDEAAVAVTHDEAAVAGGQDPAPRKVSASFAMAGGGGWFGVGRVVDDPAHAPELLALAAVETIGPRAGEWARRTREMYPTATAQGIARLAVAEFTRRGTAGGVLASVAGTYAPVALLGAAAWTHAELVLHVAAAHGREAADPKRAAELLMLCRVHPTIANAETALAAAQRGARRPNGDSSGPSAGPGTDVARRLGRPVATQVGGWLAVRAVERIFPGIGVLVATLLSRGAAEGLGVRATAFYEGR
jgi:hypothetical protein